MPLPSLRDVLRAPVAVAPMAGGPSTPALVVAAAEAGALGFLAGGYKGSSDLAADIATVAAATSEPFGVNLFVPGLPTPPEVVDRYMRSLTAEADAVGATLGDAVWDDDQWEAKLAVVLEVAPPLVSFTFGCPAAEVVGACHDAGSLVAVTVTGPEEAEQAAAAGADALCTQGVEAAAHQGSFDNDDRPGHDFGILSLLGAVARVTELPQIAAGGVVGPRQLQAVLAAGAVAAQCGTAFLRAPESGANPTYKAALTDPRFTVTAFTRAFSGRRARGLVNRFMLEHADAPAAYPEINNATRALRAAAAAQGDPDRISLWAGQGFRSATDRPVAEVVAMLQRRPG